MREGLFRMLLFHTTQRGDIRFDPFGEWCSLALRIYREQRPEEAGTNEEEGSGNHVR